MAKALFHKSQRVYVKPVGTWALIEKVIPHWVKDIDEPLRVTYEVGLGREFQANEMISEQAMHDQDRVEDDEDIALERWRIQRVRNRAHTEGNNAHHPYPGTFPVVMTDEQDWGGWRVPSAEYDRDPQRLEHQARMIVNAPDMLRLCRKIAEYASDNPGSFPDELEQIAKRCASILRFVYELDGELPELSEAG